MPNREKIVTISQEPLPVIGWREQLALPELGIPEVKAKIDTGARSSALHVFDLEAFQQDGRMRVRFKVHPYQRDTHRTVLAQAELIDQREVRNSGGYTQLRPVIQTLVELGEFAFPIELTLTNRDKMSFRMLLGRQAVRQRFLVDAGQSFLQSRTGRKTRQQAEEKSL
ncbi:RimK/LysX family protein [Microcoleus sp. ZQ-A2]